MAPRARLCLSSRRIKGDNTHMPYVNIKITREGATATQKAEIIKGVTDLLQRVLNKNPATTFVVIDEVALEDWGIGGLPVDEFRRRNPPR
jgi:4-oxalocrotonate tautomerase